MRASLLPIVVLAALSAPLSAQSPIELVRRAADAMGGEARLRALRTSNARFESVTHGHGQQQGSHAPPRGLFASGREVTDFAGSRRRLEQEIRISAAFSVRVRLVADGAAGLSEQNGRIMAAAAPQYEALVRGIRHAPARLILRALDAPQALRALGERRLDGRVVRAVSLEDQDRVTILFDAGSGLPVATETVADDPVLGDRVVQTVYSQWLDASGLLWPRQEDVRWNGEAAQHRVLTSVTLDAELADSLFAIPDSIRARGITPPAAPVVTLAELAPGVWRAEGGSHHSLVVEQGQELVLFEAPLDAMRTDALLDTLRSRFPSKRVSLVVASHHHWDHIGGLRAAMAAGIPVAIHERHVDLARRIASAPKTVAPDALARGRRRAPAIRPVGGALTVGRGAGALQLFALPNSHAEGLLVAYHPGSRLLFVVDALNTDATPGPRSAAAEVVAFVRSRGLDVARVVGGHGGIVDYQSVERVAAP